MDEFLDEARIHFERIGEYNARNNNPGCAGRGLSRGGDFDIYGGGVDLCVVQAQKMKGGGAMKHGKRLTREQKIYLSGRRLNVENWLCERDTAEYIRLIHRHTGTVRTIYKG
ncbi:MAG: hypothetical protein J6N52_03650 [Clostridia bacterium]|nr:hypothetical protein [Clostridia bacterium]